MSDVLIKPIIFIGVPRSGTTIIAESILANDDLAWPSNYSNKFPKIVNLNLLRKFFHNKYFYLKGNKSQLHKTKFFNKYTFKADESYPMWDLLIGSSFSKSTIEREATSEEKKIVRNYFTQLVKKQGKERLAFKITGPSRVVFLQSIFPDACFIRVKREINSTIKSLMNVDFWKEDHSNEIWWEGLGDTSDKFEEFKQSKLELTTYQVYKLNQLAESELKKSNANFIEVDYESFINTPTIEIQRICKFCDLTYSEEIKKFIADNPLVDRNKESNKD